MQRMLGILVAVALAAPTAAAAQLGVGLRVGWAAASGDAAEGETLSDGFESQVPIQLDALYAVTRDFAVGGYFSWGFGRIGDELDRDLCSIPGVDCSARSIRLGVQGVYTANALGTAFVPWAGLGFGWEWARFEAERSGFGRAEISYDGIELLYLSAGGDYRVSDRFAFGPFFSLSVVEFRHQRVESTAAPSENLDREIPDKALHEWLQLGVRGRFSL